MLTVVIQFCCYDLQYEFGVFIQKSVKKYSVLYEITRRATFIFINTRRINYDIGKVSFKYKRQ